MKNTDSHLYKILVFWVFVLSSGSTWAVKESEVLDELTCLSIESLLNVKVQTASKFVQQIKEAPSAVSVITSKEIKYFGWRTLGDMLAALPGMHLNNDRNYLQIGARGFQRPSQINSQFLLLVDGHRMNDPIFSQALIGKDFYLDLGLIDRVEYVPGPGSSIYGSNAFFGVINVITKSATAYRKTEISGEVGSAGSRAASITKGWGTTGGNELLLSATHFYADGKDLYFPEFDTSEQNNGVADGLDYERGKKIFIKGSAGPLSFMLGHSERTKGIPTASYEQVFNDPRSSTVDRQTLFNLGYQTTLTESTNLQSKIFYNRFQYTGEYVSEDEATGNSIHNHDLSKASWWGGELELVSTRFVQHKLLAGLRFQKNQPMVQKNWDVYPYSLELDSQESSREISVYFQDEISIGDSWLLNLGVRHENNSALANSGRTLPRLGLIYQATPSTTIKALYGKAYREPNAFELYYELAGDGGQKVNPDLQPEDIQTYEMIVEHKLTQSSHVRISAYKNDVSNLITQVTDPADGLLVYQNLERAIAKGVELEWLSFCPCGYGPFWRASYSWQRVKDAATGETLINAPRHLGKLFVSLPIPESQWRMGLEAQWVSARKAREGGVGGYALANLTFLSSTFIRNAEISASVYNLFDRKYADPVGEEFLQNALAQDGRTWRVKINYRF